MSEPLDEVIRDGTGGFIETEESKEMPCSHCTKTAVVRIKYYALVKKRRKQMELLLCNPHFDKWNRRSFPLAHSITKLK